MADNNANVKSAIIEEQNDSKQGQVQGKVQVQDHAAPTNDVPDKSIKHFKELEGKYILIDAIGEGAFSTVFKAVDLLHDNRHVAIKTIAKKAINKAQEDGIRKEISIMKKLKHKNIVKLYDSLESSDNFFLVLEYCAGGEIFKQIINFTYFSEDLSRHIIVQVAEAIKYLHEEIGVAHRDIKPENLLFVPCEYKPRPEEEFHKSKRQSDGEDKIDEGYFIKNVGGGGIGVIKIADFGLSKVLWNTTTQTPCGTAGYTAPEIVKVEKYSKSVDLWAIGCVLYTLLCGFPPFFDDNNDQSKLLDKNLKGEYEFLSPWWDEISSGAKRLVSNLLNVNPLQRFNIDQLLYDLWIVEGSQEGKIRKKLHSYNENHNVDYFPSYQSLIVEEECSSDKSSTAHHHYHQHNASSASVIINGASPVTTPNRLASNHGEEDSLAQKEKRYKTIFNKNIKYQRDNSDYLTAKANYNFDSLPQTPVLQELAEEDGSSSPSISSNTSSSAKYKMKNVVLVRNSTEKVVTKKSNEKLYVASANNKGEISSSSSALEPILIKHKSNVATGEVRNNGHKGNADNLNITKPHGSAVSIDEKSLMDIEHAHSWENANKKTISNLAVHSNLKTNTNSNSDSPPESEKQSEAGFPLIATATQADTNISSLTDSLSALKFVPRRKNTLPRTPVPTNMTFDDSFDSDIDSDDDKSDNNNGNDNDNDNGDDDYDDDGDDSSIASSNDIGQDQNDAAAKSSSSKLKNIPKNDADLSNLCSASMDLDNGGSSGNNSTSTTTSTSNNNNNNNLLKILNDKATNFANKIEQINLENQLNDPSSDPLNNFSLDLNNSVMLKRRRGSISVNGTDTGSGNNNSSTTSTSKVAAN